MTHPASVLAARCLRAHHRWVLRQAVALTADVQPRDYGVAVGVAIARMD